MRPVGGREQHAELCHNMADVLSILQLRLYVVQQTRIINDHEMLVFDQCLVRLRSLLDCWKRYEVDNP